jgi:hypothetical protein
MPPRKPSRAPVKKGKAKVNSPDAIKVSPEAEEIEDETVVPAEDTEEEEVAEEAAPKAAAEQEEPESSGRESGDVYYLSKGDRFFSAPFRRGRGVFCAQGTKRRRQGAQAHDRKQLAPGG